MSKPIVDKEKLEYWLESRVGKFKRYKADLHINSIFTDDHKFKLSLSVDKNCYHCWKTDNSGPLWKLVQIIDQCSKEDAITKIYQELSVKDFSSNINTLMEKANIVYANSNKKKALYPESFQNITHDDSSLINKISLNYCLKRKIDPIKWKFGYCTKGIYKNRLIIPFFNQDEELCYWIARALYQQDEIKDKYLNPPADMFNFGKSDVVFHTNFEDSDDIFLTEGSINAISLYEAKFNAHSIQGKSISLAQIQSLPRSSRIIVCFDNDTAGTQGLKQVYESFVKLGQSSIYYVFPPTNYKDWNDMLIAENTKKINNYVIDNIKKYDLQTQMQFLLRRKK